MKRHGTLLLLVPFILAMTACSRNDTPDSGLTARTQERTESPLSETPSVLVPGSPADALKKRLAEKVEELSRPADTVLLNTTACTITIAELMNNLSASLGTRSSRLAGSPPDQIRKNLALHAERMAVQKILLARALQAGYRAAAVQVDSALEGISRRYGGVDAYRTQLSEYDISFDFVRNDTKKTVIINSYLRNVLNGDFTSDERHSQRIAAFVEDLKRETNFTFVGW
ncbi:hypothetical protein JXO52_00640 [bacterium]|nr:hypothetical protein [bacterium]